MSASTIRARLVHSSSESGRCHVGERPERPSPTGVPPTRCIGRSQLRVRDNRYYYRSHGPYSPHPRRARPRCQARLCSPSCPRWPNHDRRRRHGRHLGRNSAEDRDRPNSDSGVLHRRRVVRCAEHLTRFACRFDVQFRSDPLGGRRLITVPRSPVVWWLVLRTSDSTKSRRGTPVPHRAVSRPSRAACTSDSRKGPRSLVRTTGALFRV